MNCTYVKLGLLLLFLCNRWAQFMAILYGFAARCLFGVEFLIQSLYIVRNIQNSIETLGNLCTEPGPPVSLSEQFRHLESYFNFSNSFMDRVQMY